MTTAIAERTPDSQAIEQVLVGGDLSKLTPNQRVSYYNSVCQSLGLNPLTKPFAYITLNGKLTLYALKDCTEQLRKRHGVSITELTSQRLEDVFVVTAKASDASGRTDAATGAVPIASLKGESLANALMKAETKAKRRVTLSICGLGMLDETEVESITSDSPRGGYVVEAPRLGTPPTTPPGGIGEGPVVPADSRTCERRDDPEARDKQPKPGVPTAASAVTHPESGLNHPPYHSTQNGLPGPDLPAGAVLIKEVATSPTKNPNVTKAHITLSTGETVTTIKTPLITLAEQCCQEQTPVEVVTKATKWGVDLVAIHRVGAGAPAEDSEPLDDSRIPF